MRWHALLGFECLKGNVALHARNVECLMSRTGDSGGAQPLEGYLPTTAALLVAKN